MKILNVLVVAIIVWLIIQPRAERWQLWVMGTEKQGLQTHTVSLHGSLGWVSDCGPNDFLKWDDTDGHWGCGSDEGGVSIDDLSSFTCTTGTSFTLDSQSDYTE